MIKQDSGAGRVQASEFTSCKFISCNRRSGCKMMTITTKNFGEIGVSEDRIIHFPNGIIGFPELTDFMLIHDDEEEKSAIRWMQSLQEPAFAMPVMDPLLVKEDYNPEIADELLEVLGELDPEDLLVLVTVTVPQDLKKMSVNPKGPMIINVSNRKACQIIIDGEEYKVKFPIYEILEKRKAGE